MVVAKLAWLKLSPQTRQFASKILKSHPHYGEFLAADRPHNIAEDEWVFMRAATWPDWVRSHHAADYNKPKWHYVDIPYVPLYSILKTRDFPTDPPNGIERIPTCIEKIRSGTAEEKSVYFCWLLHLVGDIHQPLHCTSLFSEAFPTGDKGGNLSLIRIDGGRPVKLHPTWDALLGKSTSLSSIDGAVTEIQRLEQAYVESINRDLQAHVTKADFQEL